MPEPTAHHNLAEYYSVGEAAEFLGVSAWTLRNWDKAGKLKPHRHPINGHRLYRHEDLEALLALERPAGRTNGHPPPSPDWADIGEAEHFVQFYESDAFLLDSVSGFLATALGAGDAAVVIATRSHRHGIEKRFKARGLDLAGARAQGQYVALDAAETLAQFMVDEVPDRGRFAEVIGSVITRAAAGRYRVRAFGEMVALLWAEGRREAAIRLEELWNDLAKTHTFALFCAYPMQGFGGGADGEAFGHICTEHARVLPSESYAALPTPDERLRAITLLQQKARALEAEIAQRKQAEKTLARRERELSDFLENSVEGLHQVGPDGIILWANKAELDLLGYRPEEYVGHHITEFHADRGAIDDMLAKLLRGETLYDYPATLRCKDGSVKHVLVHSNAYFEDGKFVHTRCFTRDVTERRRAEAALRESERRFAGFMRHLPGLAWIKDAAGRYVFANEAAERAFRTPRTDLDGKTDDEVFPPEVAAQFRENDRRALASPAGVQVVETLEHDDGVLHHSVVSKFPIPGPDGAPAFVGGMAIDITDRQRAEDALREADRRKDEFLATLAHELRNPLAPIRNALQVARLTGAGDPVRDMMERQVNHLVRLVDDLLEVSRVTRGRIELRPEPVDLATVVQSAVETSRPWVEAAGHRLEVALPAEPLVLDADPVRLAQVVANLLNNAARYTDRGGRIELVAERRGGEAVVRVRDTGIGIPADMLPRIFDMFTQVNRSSRSAQGGLGIGLALVRSLVTMHGGSVEAASAGPGRGSEFTVRLPLMADGRWPVADSQSHPPSAIGAPAPAGHPQSLRLLVVDDNRDAATSLGTLLKLTGSAVAVAHDGPGALEAIRRDRPDVVFLDLGMPGMDGYEVARRVRAEPEGNGVVLVALTGWGQDEDRSRSRAAGLDHHLVKPVDFDAVQAILAAAGEGQGRR